MTVSLPLDITNGTLEEVFHTSPGGVGRKDPTKPATSSRRVGNPDPDVREQPPPLEVIHDVSSSEDEMEGITMPGSPLEVMTPSLSLSPAMRARQSFSRQWTDLMMAPVSTPSAPRAIYRGNDLRERNTARGMSH